MAGILSQMWRRNQQSQNNDTQFNDLVAKVRQSGPSETVFQKMLESNPVAPNGLSFKDVCEMAKGKTPEQVFQENGLNFDQFKNMQW